MSEAPSRSRLFRIVRAIGCLLICLLSLVVTLWVIGALYYDFPIAAFRVPFAALYPVLVIAVSVRLRRSLYPPLIPVVCFLPVLAWWLTLKPGNDRNWQPDVAQTAWAEVKSDEVTLHNVRNCDYRTETDYTPRWETRTVRLSQVTGIDLAITYWGSPWMAHPIASFQFADTPPLCFSIETRKEVGEEYSAIGGFYRQYELIYIAADERDVICLRTNFRRGEDVYLYRTTIPPEKARERFMEYITALNELHEHPRWYNAATTNCTTSIRTQHTAAKRAPWDWRILVNGKGDELLYERGTLATGGLPFSELKDRAHINAAAVAADASPDFTTRIRKGRPGF